MHWLNIVLIQETLVRVISEMIIATNKVAIDHDRPVRIGVNWGSLILICLIIRWKKMRSWLVQSPLMM